MSDSDSTSSTPGPQPADPAGADGWTRPGGSWRQQRRAERRARRAAWRDSGGLGWGGVPMGGVIILIIGVVFLAGNFGFVVPHNWWAVLILIPAVAALVNAIRFYRTDGIQSPRVMGAGIGGLVMLTLALALFFELSWSLFWPVVLIVIGGSIILRNYWWRGR